MRSLPTALPPTLIVAAALLGLLGRPLLGQQAAAVSPPASAWDRAVAATQAGRFDEAVTEAGLAVADHPEHAGSHFLLGSALLRLGRIDEALPSLERAYDLAADETSYALAVATARLKSSRSATAVEPLAAVLQRLSAGSGALDEKERTIFARLLARAALDSPADAAGLLERGVVLLPEQTVLWLALAETERQDGRPQRAYETLLRGLRQNPDDRRPGDTALQLASNQAAEEIDPAIRSAWWRRAAEVADLLDPSHLDAATLRTSADAWLAAGEPTVAAARLQAAARIADADADLLYRLARCALATGDTADAEQHLVAALDARPGAELEPRIQRALATLYHRRGEFDRAAEAYRQAGMSAEADALAELARTRRECLDLRARLQSLLDASEAPANSPERRAITAELEATRVTCADVLAPPVL